MLVYRGTYEEHSETIIEQFKKAVMNDLTKNNRKKFSEVISNIRKKSKEQHERVLSRLPDQETMKYIMEHTERTFEANKGNLDKESFRLGMIAMHYHLTMHK